MIFTLLTPVAIIGLFMYSNIVIYTKLGRYWWEALVPFYNLYVLFDVLYSSGVRFLLMFIPFYGIYVAIKSTLDLGSYFDKPMSFRLGMVFMPIIFYPILAFTKE